MKETMLIFDLDGTLWDSAKEVADSWDIVLHKYYPESPHLTAEDIYAVMGKTMDEIAKTICTDLEPEERASLFAECEEFELKYIEERGGTLFPEVEETLKALKDAGYRMAIVSNCQTGYIRAFLDSMNMGTYFCDYEEWGTTKLIKADNILLVMERNHAQKAVYIGDTDKDETAARGAEIPFIYAEYGFGEVSDPDAVITHFGELPVILEKLIG